MLVVGNFSSLTQPKYKAYLAINETEVNPNVYKLLFTSCKLQNTSMLQLMFTVDLPNE
jgi:hypothetical protein